MYINAKCHIFQEFKQYFRHCEALTLTKFILSCNLVFAPCICKGLIFGASVNI